MTINLNGVGIDYGVILPELVVVATLIVVLFLELVVPADRRRWLAAVTVVGLLGALVASIPLWGQNRAAFGGTVIGDSLGAFFDVLLAAISILTVLISPRFLRFNLALFPDAAHSLGPALALLATIGILYGAFMALVQTDLKRLVAYASMSHLGFIGLGIFAGNLLGIEGALVQMVNHGVIIAALFLVVGMIERRTGTRDRGELRGLAASAPMFAALFLVVSLAALGLPGLNGFVGEFLIMLGAWTAFVPLAVAAGIGVVLAAWYVLRFYQGAFEEVPVQPAALTEMRLNEVGALAPLLAIIVVFGIVPSFFPAAVDATVRAVLRT